MAVHVFIVMPFGCKEGIDFNRVYADYIRPSLERDGCEVFRADEELRAGEIRADMFQELLIADLVIADLSIDNPNVWYELGVRHALRARGIILIQSNRRYQPFDLYTDRKLYYHVKDGVPDPAFLDADREALAGMARMTISSWQGRKISPVYRLLPNLQEPDWKSLRIGDVREFWELYDSWEQRVRLARKSGRIGNLLVLADEAPVAAFRSDAWICAGEALLKAGRYDFAIEQLEKGLAIHPGHLKGLQAKGICLQRLACAGMPGYSLDRARLHYRNVLQLFPDDQETLALLGRVEKDAWVASWRRPGAGIEAMKRDAAYEDALLRNAVDSYAAGYRRNPAHYYSGINALTLMHLYRHLTGEGRYDAEMAVMAGAVRYAAGCTAGESERYWARATLGDLEVLVGTPQSVRCAYKEAIAKNEGERFELESTRDQLQLLRELGFHPEQTEAAIEVFDHALQRFSRQENRQVPGRVFLFSGHMIDHPDRPVPRFPAWKEPAVAEKIAGVLDRFHAGKDDIALMQGACGGDLLFTEACLQRGVGVHWMQPFAEPEFIRHSVVCSCESWRRRYLDAREKLSSPILSAPGELGNPPGGVRQGYAYERCNLWLLYTALSYGIDKVRFICLWDGEGGDGPGGTEHMYNEVNRRTGEVTRIDIRRL